jgi:acyl-CoA thioesterase-1
MVARKRADRGDQRRRIRATPRRAALAVWLNADAGRRSMVNLVAMICCAVLIPQIRANLDGILRTAQDAGVDVLLVGLDAPNNYGPYKAAFDARCIR